MQRHDYTINAIEAARIRIAAAILDAQGIARRYRNAFHDLEAAYLDLADALTINTLQAGEDFT